MSHERKTPPKSKDSIQPIKFTLDGESNDEWVSSASGNAAAKILFDCVIVLRSSEPHEFKKPKKIVINEPNVTAVVFTGANDSQIACATAKGIAIFALDKPGKPSNFISIPENISNQPMIANYHVIKMCQFRHELVALSQTASEDESTFETCVQVINLSATPTSHVFQLDVRSAFNAGRTVMGRESILCFDINSMYKWNLHCYDMFTGKVNSISVAKPGQRIMNLCSSPEANLIAVTYNKTDETFARIKILKTATFRTNNILLDAIDLDVAPQFIGEILFFIKAGTKEVRCFNANGRAQTSTLVFHTSLTSPRRLFAAGEGVVGIEGFEDGKVQCEIFPYPLSPEIRRKEAKEMTKKLLQSPGFLTPDPASVVMEYVGEDIGNVTSDAFLVGRMNIGPCRSLSPIGQDHRCFSDGVNPWIWVWDEAHFSEKSEMKFMPMPLTESGGQSFFIELGKNQIGQISNVEQKLIVYKKSETAAGLFFTKEKELPFQIEKPIKGYLDTLLSCQSPDGRVLIARKGYDKTIQILDLEKMEKKSVKADDYIKTVEFLGLGHLDQIQFLPPKYIIAKGNVYELPKKDWRFFKSESTLKKNSRFYYYKFWMLNDHQALAQHNGSLYLYHFDPKTIEFKEDKTIAPYIDLEDVEVLPNGNILMINRDITDSHVILRDLLLYDPKTNEFKTLIESTPEKPISHFFLIDGGMIGMIVKNKESKKDEFNIDFLQIPEIVNVYKKERKEAKDEKRPGP